MDALAESLIGIDPDIPSVSSTDGKDEKLEENKSAIELNPVSADSDEAISDVNKTNCSIDTEEQTQESSSTDIIHRIDDKIEEAKSNLSEFLKVGNDPLQNAVVLNEFEDNLDSERNKIIEDLISTTESTTKEDLLTYAAHFDVLNTEKEECKVEDVNMDIDTILKKSDEAVEVANNPEKQAAIVELNIEDKIKELLVDDDQKVDDKVELTKQITSEMSTKYVETSSETKNGTDNKEGSKDDIDMLLSTLMPDLESTTKPDDIMVPKKQSTQYLREVLDKSEERGTKRKISTDSEPEEKEPKKARVLPILPEVTLTKVASKKRILNFEDLMSNLTKIKLPSASWKVRISAGSNPFSIVEFHEKEKLLRSVKFFKDDFHFKILFNNLPIELLGAPDNVHSLDDVSVLLSIVNTLIKNDPVVHYL